MRELFEGAGAKEIMTCKQGFGLHLMGGCVIGKDPEKSVVSPDYTLHADRRVYVADSSIFPASPGINPSFTIMALSLAAARKAVEA